MGERGAMGGCFSCVENGSVGLVTQCGAFKRIATPGVNCICCCTGEMVQATLNLRQQQLNVELETKTKDDVSVKVVVSVQYLISNDKDFSEEGSYYKAYYKLNDPELQIVGDEILHRHDHLHGHVVLRLRLNLRQQQLNVELE